MYKNTNIKDEIRSAFWLYMSLLLIMFILSCTAGFFDTIGYKRGVEEGFFKGQVEAMHGKWHYTPQIIITTNMVHTNYFKTVTGVPPPLKIDISPVQYKSSWPNSFLFTSNDLWRSVFDHKETKYEQ